MDASVLNLKNTALTNAQQNIVALPVKGETASNSAVFLDMMKQIGKVSVNRHNGLEGTLIARTRQAASVEKPKPAPKQTAEKTEKADFTTTEKPAEAPKETAKAPDAPAKTDKEVADKPAVETQKPAKETTDGQKIPAPEKDAAVVEETVLVPTETLPLQTDGEELFVETAEVAVAENTDEAGVDTGMQDKIARSAGLVGSIAVIAQQIIAQTTPETQTVQVVEGDVAVADPNAVADINAVPVNEQALSVNEAVVPADGQFIPVETAQAAETKTVTPVQNTDIAETDAVPEDFAAVLKTADTSVKETVEVVRETKAPVDIKQAQQVDTTAVEQTVIANDTFVTPEKTSRRADGVAQRQAQEIAAALPEKTHLDIQVDTAQQTVAVASVAKQKGVETEDVLSVRETVAQPVSDAPEISLASNNDSIAAVKPEGDTFQYGANAQQNADASRNAVNVLQNAGQTAMSSDKGGFSNALKSSTAIDGVTGAQSAPKADMAAVFGSQNTTLKGKADGLGQAAQTAAKPAVPTNDLIDQIKVNVAKAAQSGTQKVNITLKPKELGNIQVTMEIGEDGDLKATIIASRASTLELLQKDSSGLQKALSDAGFKMNENSLNFSYRGEQQHNAQSFGDTQSGAHHRSDGNDGYALPAENAAIETDEALTEAVIASAWSSGRHSLNIRI